MTPSYLCTLVFTAPFADTHARSPSPSLIPVGVFPAQMSPHFGSLPCPGAWVSHSSCEESCGDRFSFPPPCLGSCLWSTVIVPDSAHDIGLMLILVTLCTPCIQNAYRIYRMITTSVSIQRVNKAYEFPNALC